MYTLINWEIVEKSSSIHTELSKEELVEIIKDLTSNGVSDEDLTVIEGNYFNVQVNQKVKLIEQEEGNE